MQFAALNLAIAALFSFSNAAVLDLSARDSAVLAVTLTSVDNAVFKAVVKNVGAKDLNLLAFGTIFDSAPVEKLSVSTGGMYLSGRGYDHSPSKNIN